MKPLTIEEVKAVKQGDWLWVHHPLEGDFYVLVVKQEDNCMFVDSIKKRVGWLYYYSYGTDWLAYKNKEQAKRNLPDVQKKCCSNCRQKGFDENNCDKLNKLFAEKGLPYEDAIFSSSSDRWVKRHDLMEDYCCDDFDSKWLEYPIAVAEVQCSQPRYNEGLGHKVGQLVKIRPCDKEYEDKTYLGFYLGDLPLSIHQCFNSASHILNIFTHSNPAIFVPQLNKIIFGCESWWQEITNPDELKDITDECINNQWYVKALKELNKKD